MKGLLFNGSDKLKLYWADDRYSWKSTSAAFTKENSILVVIVLIV